MKIFKFQKNTLYRVKAHPFLWGGGGARVVVSECVAQVCLAQCWVRGYDRFHCIGFLSHVSYRATTPTAASWTCRCIEDNLSSAWRFHRNPPDQVSWLCTIFERTTLVARAEQSLSNRENTGNRVLYAGVLFQILLLHLQKHYFVSKII